MIDLAQCEDFDLGSVTIRPSSREIVGATVGTVEPKVMQLLVVLARQAGRVVSRDALIEQCWGGRIVGEDAINRVIGKLRRAAEDAGSGAFRIETVARVGLRLLVCNVGALPPPQAPPTASPRTVRLPILAGLAIAAAAAVAIVFETARPTPPAAQAQAAPRLPAAVSDLETRGLAAMFENSREQTAEGVAYLQQATALAPQSAPLWGSLAMSYVLSLGWATPSEQPALTARVRDAAAHGLAVDAGESRSTAALLSLEPTFRQWDRKAQLLQSALHRTGSASGPLAYQQVQFLLAVGHTDEALRQVERLARLSPLVPWIQATRIDLLAASGRLAEADRAADDARAIWPRDRLIWFTRFDLAAFNGQPARALAMTADRAGWPKQTAPEDILLAERTVRAIIARDAQTTAAVLRDHRAVAGRGQAYAERAMRAAAALGRPADALAFAQQLYGTDLPAQPRETILPYIGLAETPERSTAALFLPPLATLWSRPAFAALVAEIGLAGYWQHTAPPSLCAARPAPPLCLAAEAGRAGARRRPVLK